MEREIFTNQEAPGAPGVDPHWSTSAKEAIGSALQRESLVWFTVAKGVVTEVYYPSVDSANNRDIVFLVSGKDGFFSDERVDCEHKLQQTEVGVPCLVLTNTCKQGRYRLVKEIITDPSRPVLVQRVTFEPLVGEISDYCLYCVLNAHMRNHGYGNTGWCEWDMRLPTLFAKGHGTALAMCSEPAWIKMSAGFLGARDPWHIVSTQGSLAETYQRASGGNVVLSGEIDLKASGGKVVLSLGFGAREAEAAHHARAVLLHDFEAVRHMYVQAWRRHHDHADCSKWANEPDGDMYHISRMVLRLHDSKQYPGGIIASLSYPWGATSHYFSRGGYHLAWPRDAVEAAQAQLAMNDPVSACDSLVYLLANQQPDGHWPQNTWLDGRPYWTGIQADQTAFVILLAGALRRCKAVNPEQVWPSVREAAAFMIRSGPATEQDRWEENSGYSVFTLAAEVAALVSAADFAAEAGEDEWARFLLETADCWNENIEDWTYVRGSRLAEEHDVEGHYVRIAPKEAAERGDLAHATIQIRNRPGGESEFPVAEVVSPDALGLVLMGIRRPDDSRVAQTVKIIDATLKVEMKTGPGWRRYSHDGYGEHADGAAYNGVGIGRCWPLLAGERGHYELARGNIKEARRLLETMARQSSAGGLIPEQVWNGGDIPERSLYNGRPTGSACPLVWAHSEFIKLARSLHDKKVFEIPPSTAKRYKSRRKSEIAEWRFDSARVSIPKGRKLRLITQAPARVRWSADGWSTTSEDLTSESAQGLHFLDLPVHELAPGTDIKFTFFWPAAQRWEGRDFSIRIDDHVPLYHRN